MRRHWQYLKYVLRHKWFVLQAGRKLGVSLWQLIIHDWSKFLPSEWFPYARTFYKPDGTKQYNNTDEFAYAWMLHQHRNPHHWQYWLELDGEMLRRKHLLVWDHGGMTSAYKIDGVYCVTHNNLSREEVDMFGDMFSIHPMPEMYIKEMVADWIGAGRAIKGDTGYCEVCNWYEANKEKMWLHPHTQKRVEYWIKLYNQSIQHKNMGIY